MIFASASLGTRFAGMPIPVPVMMVFMSERRSCVMLRGQRKKVLRGEGVLASAELTDHVRAALADHLLQFFRRKERQRRERALRAAGAGVAERDVEARIDLFVIESVKHLRDDVLDRHLFEQRRKRRRFLDA